TVGHDEAGSEHDLGHVVQMARGDEILETIRFAKRNGDGQDHGESGADGASDEVRGEDGSVPAGNDGNGKVKAHYGVHRKNQRRSKTSEQQLRRLVTMPVTRGTAPAQREHAVNNFHRLLDRAIKNRRKISNQPPKPKQKRNSAL